ncbi:metal ABC transporter solute-binding protein, Zn/Mn family [Leuconostoc pseudomesenteroides]|uniref:metal ABC transporter solute-binding protein, Zn/Mn family n=1 Tax=Leuconostoc pseudomesenteroides TaxID=33968 RepID=UPI0040356422
MNKQVIYAILTILLIPIGIFLVFVNMAGETSVPDSKPVVIATDNIAYQQIAAAIAGKHGKTELISNVTDQAQKTKFKKSELIITDTHESQLLTRAKQWGVSARLVIASDYITDGKNYRNVYLSPQTTLNMVTKITDQLSDMDPRNRNSYVVNKQSLLKKTAKLTSVFQNLKKSKNVTYLATNQSQELMMTQLGYQSASNDVDKLDDDAMTALEKKMSDQKIDFVLTATQDQTNHDKQLIAAAKKDNVPVVTFNQVLPQDAYIWSWQLSQLRLIQKALAQ